jgi:NitT/TauT family transport system permease protein
MSRPTLIILQLLVAVVLVLLWHVFTTVPINGVKLLPPFFFSTPSDVAARIGKWLVEGTIWHHLWVTLLEAMLALVLAPIFALWLGLGIWSKVALGVTLVFPIVFFNVYQGVREVSPAVLANARMLGMDERALMRHVYWPAALSWVFSSLHTSVGFAVVGAVVGEYLGSAAGLGYVIQQAEGVFDVAGVFAGMAVLTAFVIAIDGLVTIAERRLLVWRPVVAETHT